MNRGPHLTDDDLVLHHYGETPERDGIAGHLLACPGCRGRYEGMRSVLSLVDEGEVPDRPEDYGVRVWQRLEPRLGPAPVAMPRRTLPGWRSPAAAAAAAVVLLLAGFLAGRNWQVPGVDAPAPISAESRERILFVAVGDHLEKSRMMLVELVNMNGSVESGDDSMFDISGGRERAEDLVTASRIYRRTAEASGDKALAFVLEELERILLDIAHSPEEITHAELKRLQGRVEDQGILLKVRLIGDRIQQQDDQAMKASPGRT